MDPKLFFAMLGTKTKSYDVESESDVSNSQLGKFYLVRNRDALCLTPVTTRKRTTTTIITKTRTPLDLSCAKIHSHCVKGKG